MYRLRPMFSRLRHVRRSGFFSGGSRMYPMWKVRDQLSSRRLEDRHFISGIQAETRVCPPLPPPQNLSLSPVAALLKPRSVPGCRSLETLVCPRLPLP